MFELVNPDNFNRAESDMYFGRIVAKGGFGRFTHHRELTSVDDRTIIRPNRDTLYSSAVFDLDAGPVTITLPDARQRFMSMQVIDEEQYAIAVEYGGGSYTFDRERVGSRYVLFVVRILIDPQNLDDLARVHALQDAIEIDQDSRGRFEPPSWDPVTQAKVREALLALGETLTSSHGMFGTRAQVDPVHHLIGTAFGWGGNPEDDALYLTITPARNDGVTVYRLTVDDAPVDGFWSVTVYNARGFFEHNERGAYSVNNLTARRNEDGSITIQFGGCASDAPNCLPITAGWSYTVRLYLPRRQILTGEWVFPDAHPVGRDGGWP